MNDTALQKEIGIKLLPNQLKIVQSPAKDKVVCAGRRFGKSFTCGYIVLKKFLEGMDEIRQGERDKLKIWIIAPTYTLTNKVFYEFVNNLRRIDKRKEFTSFIKGGTGRPAELKVSQDIFVECKSTTEPQSLLGEGVDLAIVDEAPLISNQIYQQNILPTLLEGGEVVFIGTPRGKNWFYHKFIKGKDDYNKFHYKSIEGRIDENDLNTQRNEFSDDRLFKQEYEAEFIEGAMQVFQDIDSVLRPPYELYQGYNRGDYYVMGVDLAKSEDYTVISVFNTNTNKQVYWKRFNLIDYSSQIEQILAVRNEYGGAKIILDTTGLGEPVKDMLEARGAFVEDFTFSGKTKEALISKLRLFMANKWLLIADEKPIRDELEAFEFILINEKTGEPLKNVQYGAPRGTHDDCVISLALGVWGLLGKANPETPIQKEFRNIKKYKKPESFV